MAFFENLKKIVKKQGVSNKIFFFQKKRVFLFFSKNQRKRPSAKKYMFFDPFWTKFKNEGFRKFVIFFLQKKIFVRANIIIFFQKLET